MEIGALRSLLHYEPETGLLYWKSAPRRGRARGLAGPKVCPDGYRRVKILNRTYTAHRVVWAIYFGEWPRTTIDHINGVPSDNRIENLRLCTTSQNVAHQHKKRPSRSGHRGVYACRNKWSAKIVVSYKPIFLGTFATKEEAAAAYRSAAKKYFGEFAPKAMEA